jgi:hypothetical protein
LPGNEIVAQQQSDWGNNTMTMRRGDWRARQSAVLTAVVALLATMIAGAVGAPRAAADTTGSAFVAVSPTRLLDTRTAGAGGTDVPLGAGATRMVQVTGIDGVPSDPSDVTAVVLNVTVVNATAGSFLTVYPDGGTRSTTSNLDFAAGQTAANMVITQVSSATGAVDIYNKNGNTDILVDLTGYYTTVTSGTGTLSTFDTVTPTRVLDTRNGTGETGGVAAPLGTDSAIAVTVAGNGDGVPSSGVTSVVINLTVANPTADSFLTVYPVGDTRPSTSNLDFSANETIANLVVVPLDGNGTKVDIYNRNGATDVVADVFGYYTTGTGATFTPVTPTRMLDTRTAGTGGTDEPLQPKAARALQITGVDGVPADTSSVTAVVLHVTVVNPTAASFLTLYADGTAQPTTSNLNFVAGQLISNLAVVPLGANGAIDLLNNLGTTDVVVDISGYYST